MSARTGLRICLVGGIFGKPASYREQVPSTPETVLAAGLVERGHEVDSRGHQGPFDYSGFDVVHVHHLAWGAMVAAAGTTPFVFTRHSGGERVLLRRAAQELVTRRADVVVALSQTEYDTQRIPRERMRVIPNGIDDGVFAFAPPPVYADRFELLFVGQLVPVKGLDVLMAALARVELNVRLRLVYHVDDEEARLREQAAKLGLDVEFLGPRSPAELSALYAESHALVLPSRSEALPSVVTEALLVGRPVIASDVGAIREQLGDFGALAPPGDESALAGAIASLATRYRAVAADAERVSRATADRYSVPAMVTAHEALYSELAARGARRRPLLPGAAAAIAGRVASG